MIGPDYNCCNSNLPETKQLRNLSEMHACFPSKKHCSLSNLITVSRIQQEFKIAPTNEEKG